MVAAIGGSAAILEQEALESAIVRLAHGGMDADVGGDPGQDDVAKAFGAQHQFEVGGAKRALAGLVDDGLARRRFELRDDFPTRLAAHQDAAARTRIADAGADALRAPALVLWKVGKVGAVTLPRVNDAVTFGAHGVEHGANRIYRRPRQREIVAHGIDVAAL